MNDEDLSFLVEHRTIKELKTDLQCEIELCESVRSRLIMFAKMLGLKETDLNLCEIFTKGKYNDFVEYHNREDKITLLERAITLKQEEEEGD